MLTAANTHIDISISFKQSHLPPSLPAAPLNLGIALLTSITYEVKTPDNDPSKVWKIPYFLFNVFSALLLFPLIISALELLGAPSSAGPR